MTNQDYVYIYLKKKISYSIWPLCSSLGSIKKVREILIFVEIGKKYAITGRIGSSVVLKNMDYGVKMHVAKICYRRPYE